MPNVITPEMIKQTTDFHGHWCPGLAIGIRASEWALQEIGKNSDEEIVAVVETDMCGVDAVQFLTGCTFGKGNLIYQDYGKNAFSFYRRRDGKAARLVARSTFFESVQPTLGDLHAKLLKEGLSEEEEKQWKGIRSDMSSRIMNSRLEDVFEVKPPAGPEPKKARILSSMVCGCCNEPVMESRTRHFQQQVLCIPCFEKQENRM